MKKSLILLAIVVAIVTTTIFATRAPKSAIATNKIAMKDEKIKAKKLSPPASYYYWFYTDRTWAGLFQTVDDMVLNTGFDPYDYSPKTAQYYGFYQWNVVEDQYGGLHPFPSYATPDKVMYSHP